MGIGIDGGESPQRGAFRAGDRVRVVKVQSAYTGCRGTVEPGPGGDDGDGLPLGYYVAIDGENGVLRPFLAEELEPLTAARVRPTQARAAEDRAPAGR